MAPVTHNRTPRSRAIDAVMRVFDVTVATVCFGLVIAGVLLTEFATPLKLVLLAILIGFSAALLRATIVDARARTEPPPTRRSTVRRAPTRGV